MTLYSTSVFVHVITAILGLGPLTALALVSSSARVSVPRTWFTRLLRVVSWSLMAMLVTGVLILAQTHGAFGKTGWVRVSVGLFVVLGLLLGIVQRRLKRSSAEAISGDVPGGLTPLLWAMCALIVAITYLMEAKPW